MTTVDDGRASGEQQRGSAADPVEGRLTFREPVSGTGFVDAAWWPHSRELVSEILPLLEVLSNRGREITRVTYNIDAWDATPRRSRIRDRTVRFGGFRTSQRCMIRLSDAWGRERIDVLIIPPATDPATADRVLRLAASGDSTCSGEELLAMSGRPDGSDPVRSP